MSLVGRENVYTCTKCGGYTVTIDVDEGVTPMLLACRANPGATCDGWGTSAGYPDGPRPAHIPPASWEWYRPSAEERASLAPAMAAYVEEGGLMIRPRILQ